MLSIEKLLFGILVTLVACNYNISFVFFTTFGLCVFNLVITPLLYQPHLVCACRNAHFIVNLNELMPNAHKYIMDMLDDIHIYVHHHVFEMVTKQLQEFHNQNTYEKPL